MNRNEVMLGCSDEEAKALRTALNIATRLCLHLPDGLNHKEWGAKFNELHRSLVLSNVGILDGAPQFSDRLLSRVQRDWRSSLVSADFSDIEARVGATLHSDLLAAYGRPTGGKTMFSQDALLAALMAAWMRPRDLGAFAFGGTHSGRSSASTGATTNIPVKPAMTTWKVQFDSSPVPNTDWRDIESLGEFTSRNQAYRKMRERCKRYGYAPSLYRVVPQDTPQGKEKDRGFYTVEFMFPGNYGWDTSYRPGLSGTFVSVEGARAALDSTITATGKKRATLLRSYRIKWHPTKP